MSVFLLLPLVCPLLGTWPATQACALDWESNLLPVGSQAGTQSTEPHQPGLSYIFLTQCVTNRCSVHDANSPFQNCLILNTVSCLPLPYQLPFISFFT